MVQSRTPSNRLGSSSALGALALALLSGATLLASATATAALAEYRVHFEPSPSPQAAGYTLHIGDVSGTYPVEFDLGAPPASGGTIIYAVDLEDSVDLFVAVRAYDESGTESSFSNEIQVSAVVPVPAEPTPTPTPEPEEPPAPEPPAEEPLPDTSPASGLHLDGESEAIRRDVLEQAVIQVSRTRSLFISPGLIDRVATEGSARIIFDAPSDMTDETSASDRIVDILSGTTDGSVMDAAWSDLRVFGMLGRAAAQVGPEALRRLIEAGFIERIETDTVHRPSLDSSIPLVQASLTQQAGLDGEGHAIAILDTGVDSSHPMLVGRVVAEACFSRTADCPNGETEMIGSGAGAPCALAGCGHGTGVGAVAAGGDGGIGLPGVAPAASLVSVQVFSDVDGMPGAYASDILAGLQHVLSLTAFHEIAVVNLALGSELYGSEAACDEAGGAQHDAIGLLREAGVATVAAAGNDGRTDALALPACLSNVMSVGSSSDLDRASRFSNSASFLSLLAPGEDIETAEIEGGTVVATGTSFAAAHVAGAFAVLREASPDASVGEIENALRLTGRPISDDRNGITTPRLRLEDASELLAVQSGSGETTRPSAIATSSSGSSAGLGQAMSCGLVGVEPFLILGLVRLLRRRSVGSGDLSLLS